MNNSADVDFTLAGWLVEEPVLCGELQRTPIGTDMEAPDDAPMLAVNPDWAGSLRQVSLGPAPGR